MHQVGCTSKQDYSGRNEDQGMLLRGLMEDSREEEGSDDLWIIRACNGQDTMTRKVQVD